MSGNIGAIHISEIEPTLLQLEKDLGIDLRGNVLGSVGKKRMSGDIDVAVALPDDCIPALVRTLEQSNIVEYARKSSLVIISKVEIQEYNPDIYTDLPRTGYVQVDFMTSDDIEWLKTFYHAPHPNVSRYKGAHRNIVIGALSKYVDPVYSEDVIADGRPVYTNRFMYSSKQGLVRIQRRPKPRKDGKGYTKAHVDSVFYVAGKTSSLIAETLNLGDASALDSFESVFAAIKANHGEEIANNVAHDLSVDASIKKLGIPSELDQYLED